MMATRRLTVSSVTARAVTALLVLAGLVAGCSPAGSEASAAASSIQPVETPGSTGSPAPGPTATHLAEASVPRPAPIPPEDGELLIRVISHGHTGSGGDPGTTILEDGRVIWSRSDGEVVEARVARDALRRLREDIEANAALDADATFLAKLRAGAQPPGHGVNGYTFEVVRDGRLVTVGSQDPRSFAGEEEFWIISPEMRSLAALGRRLDDPVAG